MQLTTQSARPNTRQQLGIHRDREYFKIIKAQYIRMCSDSTLYTSPLSGVTRVASRLNSHIRAPDISNTSS